MKARIAFYRAVKGVSSGQMNIEFRYEFDLVKQRKAINEALDSKGIKERSYRILKIDY